MKVYQRLAADFVAEGVTYVFGIMGDGNMYWMHELDKLGGVKMLEVRHEGAGLGMADGWARVTRTPGVATTTCGPGVTQLATALITASRAASPLVAFCGEFPSNDDEYLQRMDQAAFAAGCETGFIRITSPEVADDCVRKAFYLAKLESRPIMLSAPMDVQQMAFEDYDEPYKPSSTVLPKRVVHPDPAEIEKAADIIAGAKHPVGVAGRGPCRRLLRADGRKSRRGSAGECAREALGQDDRLSHRGSEEAARRPACGPHGIPGRAGRRGAAGDLPCAGRDAAPRNRRGHGQRCHCGFLEHAVQQAALPGAARSFLRLHRADAAGGDGGGGGERQQAARAV